MEGGGFQGRWVSYNTSRRLSGVQARRGRGRRYRNLSGGGLSAPSGLFARPELEIASAGYLGAWGCSCSLRARVRPRPRRGWRSVKISTTPSMQMRLRVEKGGRPESGRPPAFPPSAAGGRPAKPVLGGRVPARRARPRPPRTRTAPAHAHGHPHTLPLLGLRPSRRQQVRKTKLGLRGGSSRGRQGTRAPRPLAPLPSRRAVSCP